jgi:hypothetical protein
VIVTPDQQVAWAMQQLEDAGVSDEVKNHIIPLLTVFYSQQHSIEVRSQVLDLFDSLAHLHAIRVRADGPEVWVPARAGQIGVNDQVRIKRDAMDASNPMAIYYNGRRGVIVAIRRGDIYVSYRDGKEPKSPDTGIRIQVEMLEKRVK